MSPRPASCTEVTRHIHRDPPPRPAAAAASSAHSHPTPSHPSPNELLCGGGYQADGTGVRRRVGESQRGLTVTVPFEAHRSYHQPSTSDCQNDNLNDNFKLEVVTSGTVHKGQGGRNSAWSPRAPTGGSAGRARLWPW